MSSGQRPERVVHQDYIARIRYSNALPPPPFPPKLLDIPGTGLAGGQYTSAGYASKMAREQPLNIEADAELGMHIDMIGVPGIFTGDTRAIYARPSAQLHPADKALMKPLSAMGKGNATGTGVSFLRRTEYTASQGPQHFASNTSKDMMKLRNDPKRRKLNTVDKDDPINIIRNIVKGFDIAYPADAYRGEDNTKDIKGAAITDAEIKAWSRPRHPTKPNLQLLDSYPVLPDLDALPVAGGFAVMKFQSNPLLGDTYDQRLDAGLLRVLMEPQKVTEFERKKAEWDASDKSKPEPTMELDYDFCVAGDVTAVHGIKRKFDVTDQDKDDDDLYTDQLETTDEHPERGRCFAYERLRTYETYNQHGNPNNFYNDSIALALHDPESVVGEKRLAKAAYYYPIMQRTAVRPKRKVGRLAATQAVEDVVDGLNVIVRDFADDERESQLEKRAQLDPMLQDEVALAVEAAA